MLEKLKNRRALFVCFIKTFTKEVYFLLRAWTSQNTAILVCFLTTESRKKLAHHELDTFATHSSLVHELLHWYRLPRAKSQHSGPHFITFKQWVKICFNRTRNGVKKTKQKNPAVMCANIYAIPTKKAPWRFFGSTPFTEWGCLWRGVD